MEHLIGITVTIGIAQDISQDQGMDHYLIVLVYLDLLCLLILEHVNFMPYIKPEARQRLHEALENLRMTLYSSKDNHGVLSPGDLNYVISKLIWKLFDDNPSYTLGNNIIGVLECVKQEFYRRKMTPYEEEKMRENGDI